MGRTWAELILRADRVALQRKLGAADMKLCRDEGKQLDAEVFSTMSLFNLYPPSHCQAYI